MYKHLHQCTSSCRDGHVSVKGHMCRWPDLQFFAELLCMLAIARLLPLAQPQIVSTCSNANYCLSSRPNECLLWNVKKSFWTCSLSLDQPGAFQGFLTSPRFCQHGEALDTCNAACCTDPTCSMTAPRSVGIIGRRLSRDSDRRCRNLAQRRTRTSSHEACPLILPSVSRWF